MRDGSKIHVAVPAVPLSLPLKRPLCTISFSANRACMITVRFRPRLPVSAAAPGPVYSICHTALHRPAALCNGMDAAFSPSLHLQWFYFSGFLWECQALFLQNSQGCVLCLSTLFMQGPGMPSPRVKDKQTLMGKLRAAYARPLPCAAIFTGFSFYRLYDILIMISI